MNHRTARMSLSIKVVTAIVLAMAAGFIIGGFHTAPLMVGGLFLGVVALACYLLAPASYDISNGDLTVVFHAGRISYGQIIGCAGITERLPFTIRLFGNSGLFAGTGIFWNMRYGIFRAYLTSAKYQDWVLVRTKKYKILISPESPRAFIEATQSLEPTTLP